MRYLTLTLLLLACAHPKPSTIPTKAPEPAASAPTSLPEQAPQEEGLAFGLMDLNGKLVRAKDFQGKMVLLNFWSSTCGPCKREFPTLEALHKTYGSKGLVILGVSLDANGQAARSTAASYGLSFPNLLGGESLYRSLGGQGTPYSVLLDEDQVVTARILGYRTAEFFEGLLFAPLALSPGSRIRVKQAAARPRSPKPPPRRPPSLPSAANGWTLERIDKYGANFGALWGVKRKDGSVRVFAGGGGAIFISDGGKWTRVHDDPQAGYIEGFWGLNEKEIYAVGANSPILYSGDGGLTWAALSTRRDLNAIWGSSASDIYAVGARGLLLHSSDNGLRWQEQSSGTSRSLMAVWGSGPDDIYVGGGKGLILRSRDRGKTWAPTQTSTEITIESIWGSGPKDIYAVGGWGNGTVLHSMDGGKTWSHQQVNERDYLGSVIGFSADDVWVSGPNGYLLRSRDRGKTWKKVPTIPGAPIIFMWGSSPNELYTAGPYNTLQHF